jgi:hypothetical protein
MVEGVGSFFCVVVFLLQKTVMWTLTTEAKTKTMGRHRRTRYKEGLEDHYLLAPYVNNPSQLD